MSPAQNMPESPMNIPEETQNQSPLILPESPVNILDSMTQMNIPMTQMDIPEETQNQSPLILPESPVNILDSMTQIPSLSVTYTTIYNCADKPAKRGRKKRVINITTVQEKKV